MPLFNIGFVIFPDLTQLDFTGPLQVLSRLLFVDGCDFRFWPLADIRGYVRFWHKADMG